MVSNKIDRLLRLREVLQLFPVSRTAWFLGIREGRFPKPVHLGPRTIAWKESDVKLLIERAARGELAS